MDLDLFPAQRDRFTHAFGFDPFFHLDIAGFPLPLSNAQFSSSWSRTGIVRSGLRALRSAFISAVTVHRASMGTVRFGTLGVAVTV